MVECDKYFYKTMQFQRVELIVRQANHREAIGGSGDLVSFLLLLLLDRKFSRRWLGDSVQNAIEKLQISVEIVIST